MNAFVAVKGSIVRNISDPTQFATAVQQKGGFGINIDTGEFDPDYVPNLVKTITHLSSAIAFARQHPK